MNPQYVYGFLGGIIIGFAAVLLFWINGRIMGVSGITSNLMISPSKDSWWRWAFIGGLVLGGLIWKKILPSAVIIDASWPVLIMAGLLVGFGTVIGGGCTSGHGICGIARFSRRSITATIIFMSMGILTVWLKRLWGL